MIVWKGAYSTANKDNKMAISRQKFPDFLDAVNRSYSADFIDEFPSLSDFPDRLFNNDNLLFPLLEEFSKETNSILLKSVCERLVAIDMIQRARDLGDVLEINNVWRLVVSSILGIPLKYTISSIGSQGFLSIPLFKNDKEKKEFEFIRLHIWADSLNQYMDAETCERFSIHTHSFFAKSWTITGQVINNRYNVVKDNKGNGFSLFDVKYNDSLNRVNQHNSIAVNTGENVLVDLTEEEIHTQGSSYNILAGDYHKSGHKNYNGVSATFFSFTAKDGLADKSFVVGPSNIKESLINRKMLIDPSELIEAIDKQLNTKS